MLELKMVVALNVPLLRTVFDFPDAVGCRLQALRPSYRFANRVPSTFAPRLVRRMSSRSAS